MIPDCTVPTGRGQDRPAGAARAASLRAIPLTVALTAAIAAGAARAEGPARLLSLDESTRLALARNHDIAFERQSFRIAAESLARTDGPYDPALRLDGKWRKRTDPLNSVFQGAPAGEDAPTVENLGLEAGLQQLLPTGGTVGLSASLARETTNGLYNPISPSYPLLLGIDLRQPLLQNRSIDPARRAVRVARIDRDRSAASLKKSVADTVAAVERAYWTFVAARRDVAVQEGSVSLAREQLSDTGARIEAGTLPESDLAQPQAELERRKGELLNARESAQRAENQLKSLISGSETDPVWGQSLEAGDPPEAPIASVDLETALRDAARLRPEIREASLRVARQEVEVGAAKDRVKPQLDLVAGYSRRGLAGGTNPDAVNPFTGGTVTVPPQFDGGVGRSWGTVAENRFPDASVGLSFSVPIGNHAARADRAIAEAEREQARITLSQTTERVAVEVRNAAFALQTAAQRIEAARAGRKAAETQLMAERERFSVGLSTNFFVLTRQNDLARSLTTETAALTDYRKAAAEFGRAVGTLLEDRKIAVAE